jgi:hypothetical protein
MVYETTNREQPVDPLQFPRYSLGRRTPTSKSVLRATPIVPCPENTTTIGQPVKPLMRSAKILKKG